MKYEYVNCDICAGKRYKLLNVCKIEKEDTSIPLQDLHLVRCGSCGFVFLNPRPVFSNEELKQLYSQEYFEKGYMRFYGDGTGSACQSNEPFSYRFSLIEKYSHGDRLLDIGCADGGFLKFVREKGWSVSGVEVCQYVRDIAVGKHHLDVFCGYLEEARFEDNYFDVISAGDVLEHVNSPLKFLSEVRRVLKENGILYLAMPNEKSFYYFIFSFIARYNHRNYFLLPHHYYHFNPSTIKLLLHKAGFRTLELRLSSSKNESLFMNMFNIGDRLVVIARKEND